MFILIMYDICDCINSTKRHYQNGLNKYEKGLADSIARVLICVKKKNNFLQENTNKKEIAQRLTTVYGALILSANFFITKTKVEF
jgi:hypothetical protein